MRRRLTHHEARQIIEPLIAQKLGRPPTLAETQTAQSVAYGESHYGGDYSDETRESFNWGSVHCKTPKAPCPPECWTAFDISPKTNTKYPACFRTYPNHTEGARDMVHELLRRTLVRNAIPSQNTIIIADAMERSSYFKAPPKLREIKVRKYARLMADVAAEIARSLREPLMIRYEEIEPIEPHQLPEFAQPRRSSIWPIFLLLTIAATQTRRAPK